MGADFKSKAKKSFEKCWDRAAVAANTPDLFSKPTERAPARFEAEAIGKATSKVGDSLAVRMENGSMICRRGVSPVLKIENPSSVLLEALANGCNIAQADVVSVDPISGVFEVAIR